VNRIRYISAFDESGYGQAAIAYVRGLVNSGARVHWQPFAWPEGGNPHPRFIPHNEALLRANRIGGDSKHDLVALLRATQQPAEPDVCVMHCVPEFFPRFALPHCNLIGMTAWESSKIPAHWISLCNIPHRLIVPSAHNQRVFSAEHLRGAVHAVAHIRRAHWSEFTTSEIDRFRHAVGLKENAMTFYCVGTTDPRKNIHGLLHNFCSAFTAEQAVQLVIKTTEVGCEERAPFNQRPTTQLIDRWLREISQTLGRLLPRVRVITDRHLSQRDMDALHEIGDCYVSFSHGEGWGLGAFDAATYGNPVLMPDWGGQLDFLPTPRLGAMPMHLVPAPIWPTLRPSMWNDQAWASVETKDGVRALRSVFADIEAHRAEARVIQGFIANEFSEARVTRRLLAVINDELDA
jgi:glycosyltransferase involved in cell wall biosynthesis